MKLPGSLSVQMAFAIFLSCSLRILAADEKDYLPLAVGEVWTMDVEINAPGGKIFPATLTIEMLPGKERDGKKYLRSHTSIEGDSLPKKEHSELVRKDATGFYSLDEQVEDAKENLDVALPFVVGKTWLKIVGEKKIKFNETLVGLETVTIGGKTYEECYHIQGKSADGDLQEDIWEAPKIGSVKAVMLFGKDKPVVTFTLREFKPGQE